MTAKTALVVGAGIIGACLSYRLARAGMHVTILDAAGPHRGASGGSWAWLNAISAQEKSYFDLRQASLAAYHELEQELSGRLKIDWTGALVWDLNTYSAKSDSPVQKSWGSNARIVNADEMRALEPMLTSPPDGAIYSADDGLVDGAQATQTLIDAAQAIGARGAFGRRALSLLSEDNRIAGVKTDFGDLHADVTILAAGTGTSDLLVPFDITLPTSNRAGLLITTAPITKRLTRALWTDSVHIKQLADGRLVIGENDHAPGALDDPEATIAHMIETTQKMLPALGVLTVEKTTIATRPIPGDGYPVIGAIPTLDDAYIAMMHSGFTLAAITARLLTQEILTDELSPLLTPYRLSRFAA
ncbi:MAG: FAD-binding oxidoreductase [Alphaproteobacteria bacterium]|nr:FAD-binding oxidoreductase [Alphaproteobacteria bacterium]